MGGNSYCTHVPTESNDTVLSSPHRKACSTLVIQCIENSSHYLSYPHNKLSYPRNKLSYPLFYYYTHVTHVHVLTYPTFTTVQADFLLATNLHTCNNTKLTVHVGMKFEHKHPDYLGCHILMSHNYPLLQHARPIMPSPSSYPGFLTQEINFNPFVEETDNESPKKHHTTMCTNLLTQDPETIFKTRHPTCNDNFQETSHNLVTTPATSPTQSTAQIITSVILQSQDFKPNPQAQILPKHALSLHIRAHFPPKRCVQVDLPGRRVPISKLKTHVRPYKRRNGTSVSRYSRKTTSRIAQKPTQTKISFKNLSNAVGSCTNSLNLAHSLYVDELTNSIRLFGKADLKNQCFTKE